MESQKTDPLLEAIRITMPVMFGYVPIGIAFGLLVTHYGFNWLYSVLMSIVVFSGAAQFIAVALAVSGAGAIEIVLTMLFLNLRHSFFGLSLLNKFEGIGRIKAYLVLALTDETYALITGHNVPERVSSSRFYAYVTGLDHLYWVTGTAMGALLGKVLNMNLNGLEFSLTALFVVLSIEKYRSAKTRFPFIAAIVSGIIAMLFAGSQNMLLVSIIIGTFLLLVYEKINNGVQTDDR
ncbi:AzlC family ABC transporter permease [Methanolobus bombayensis]|uniref:AzlC family ABC transporter permease n=1 Tax=Methanolobus bombayensis TaxID=38023 RepID=UPI001AE185AA|nr:AzlC family ABC transporter permease [Methanolobus bombayensis]MBP1909913.1 4-azaleucine resistance transporter AzlC [Methanolobus bombayensis]